MTGSGGAGGEAAGDAFFRESIGGAPKIAWFITLITRTYGRYIELDNGIISQLITGGHRLVGTSHCFLTR